MLRRFLRFTKDMFFLEPPHHSKPNVVIDDIGSLVPKDDKEELISDSIIDHFSLDAGPLVPGDKYDIDVMKKKLDSISLLSTIDSDHK